MQWRVIKFMDKNNKKQLLPKSSLVIRLVAGMYLIYLAYQLVMRFKENASDGAPLAVTIVAIIIFSICGIILTVVNGKAFLKGEFQGGAMDVSKGEETEEDSQ